MVMEELRGASVDAVLPRLSRDAGIVCGNDGLEVHKDCDVGGDDGERVVEEEEEFDLDSGMGSDDFDFLEVGGESGSEFCQVGDQSCSVPLELYDLSSLSKVLSLDVWNEHLSKDEKLHLCKYLPDMDQATFMTTLKDLLSGSNIYFGNPVSKFLDMLKGGLCEPGVYLRHQGLMFFQKRQYYHFLRNYQNNMVSNCLQIKEVSSFCTGQPFEDKLKFLNEMRKQTRLVRENLRSKGWEDDSSVKDENQRELLSNERMMGRNVGLLKGHRNDTLFSTTKVFPKLIGTRQTNKSRHDSTLAPSIRDQTQDLNDTSGLIYRATGRTNHNLFNRQAFEGIGLPRLKKKKKHEEMNANGFSYDTLIDPELSFKKNMSGIKVLRSELHRKGKYPEILLNNQDAAYMDFYFRHVRNAGKKKDNLGRGSPFVNVNTIGTFYSPVSDAARNDDTESDSSDLRGEGEYGYQLISKLDYVHPGGAGGRFIENNLSLHKKRKALSFEAPTSSKKSVRTPNIKRKACDIKDDSHNFGWNSENQCFSHDPTLSSNGFTTQSCQLGNACSSVELPVVEDDELLERDVLVEDVVRGRSNRGKNKKTYVDDVQENSKIQMRGCSSVKKKNKKGEGAKRLGKFNGTRPVSLLPVESKATISTVIQPSDTCEIETSTVNVEPDPIPQRRTFTLITPTVDCSFMFSVIHLLSAVRMALITPYSEDTIEMQHEIQEVQSRISDEVSHESHPNESVEGSNSGHPGEVGVPTFSIQEIAYRVRLNPGDPCILETEEPLLDLVRGVLKLFSSKSAPQGAKGWKPIAKFERSSKSWSWIGPLDRISTDTETVEEVTSPESWGISHKMLVKLVDAYAIWLKNSQEILRELGRLPPPPASLLQLKIDGKDRLKDLRAQKSLRTISPSTEEVRDYFRREEYLRYSMPDRAFTYTAADGKKSAVAPLRRGCGKPSAKVRDHHMLKSDRPPHITILCLVRDAAARLPGSIGTRADVCTLIRDSQYVSEHVTDNQVTHILSGALDRLHYEQDPCVKFEQERKLWVYLHRDRDVEDFDEDGTLSTKKWKKSKKETTDQDIDAVEVEVEVEDTDVIGRQTVCAVTDAATGTQLDLIGYEPVDHHHNQESAMQLDLIGNQPVGHHNQDTGEF